MKKLSLLFTIVLSSTIIINAQTKSIDKKIRFGFKIDAGSSTISPKESYVSKDGGKFYFSYGFAADFLLSDNYVIATGLNITHGGGSFTTDNGKGLLENDINNTARNTYSLSLQYLEIPFALKLKTDDINGIKYWGQFGTYLGANLGARMNAVVDGKIYEKYTPSKVIPINMGLDLGAGIEYPFNSKTYGSIGFGYHNGFINLTKSDWNAGKVVLNGFFLRTAVYF